MVFKWIAAALMVTFALPAAAQNMTTAAEVKPILTAIKPNWISLREYDGQDLVYFTMIESWRCGVDKVMYGINADKADTEWEMETCYEDEGAPNAIKAEGRLPFTGFELGSVNKIVVEVTYDDGTTDTAAFGRTGMLP